MPYLYLARVPDGLEVKNPAHSFITGRQGGEFGGLGHHRDTIPQPWAMSFYPPRVCGAGSENPWWRLLNRRGEALPPARGGAPWCRRSTGGVARLAQVL